MSRGPCAIAELFVLIIVITIYLAFYMQVSEMGLMHFIVIKFVSCSFLGVNGPPGPLNDTMALQFSNQWVNVHILKN